MRKNFKETGITLIALVVTIVVIIIISAVVITLIRANGIIDKAQEAKEIYLNAQKAEQNILDNYEFDVISSRDNQDTSPIGTVISFMGVNAPVNYLACDGSILNKADYPELFEILKDVDHTGWSEADWDTQFSLPNLQGQFLRGTGTNGYSNQGDGLEIGKHQDEGLPNISGTVYDMASQTTNGAFTKNNGTYKVATGSGAAGFGNLTFNASNSNAIYGKSSHVTPSNVSVLYCIKAK